MTAARWRRAALGLVALGLLTPFAAGAQSLRDAPAPRRPVATYSIVARDPATGELGVAVQSHWFGVGAIVAFAEAGIGAVATQSFVDPSYGPLGIELMRAGRTPEEACKAACERIVTKHPDARDKQVAFLAVRKDGAIGAWSIKPGFKYAIGDASGSVLVDGQSLVG